MVEKEDNSYSGLSSQSPDFIPIEILWLEMKLTVHARFLSNLSKLAHLDE